MLVLKVARTHITVMHNRNQIFRRLSPAYGGITTKLFLDAIGAGLYEEGTWMIRSDDHDQMAEAIHDFNNVDSRRIEAPQLADACVNRVRHLNPELERIT